jgi:phosphoribosyl 1,2-cyclic phosphodiesterase
MIDAGTGFVPAGWQYLSEMGSGLRYILFFTHWHYDHIVGLTLAPPTFIDQIPMSLYGPRDHGVGPKEMVAHLFQRPFFPIDHKRVSHKMKLQAVEDFDVSVFLIHPEGGVALKKLDALKKMEAKGQTQVSFGKGRFDIRECLVIRMQRASHGNATCITYRFEEMPTGKVFVLCTDHEDSSAIPLDLRHHLADADLLIMDAQYDKTKYRTKTAGYGHGTPEGAIKHGLICGAKRLGISHHDPGSVDAFLEGKILDEARSALGGLCADEGWLNEFEINEVLLTDQDVFLAYDYEEYEV